jgi:hypothetical protein
MAHEQDNGVKTMDKKKDVKKPLNLTIKTLETKATPKACYNHGSVAIVAAL